jgi:phenylalanyl-tRNA synthetase beta chain
MPIEQIISLKTGMDVEEVKQTLDSKIVVAEIIEVKPHPNADKLRLAEVTTGGDTYTVVCGAPNIEVGMRVPLALVGANVGDIKIEPAVIRGEKSEGMLCSEKELGLGDDHSGIKILENTLTLGKSINAYFSSDSLYDLEVTPNRGDCLCHFGVAREIAACSGKSISKSPIDLKMSSKKASSEVSVSISDYELCPRYFSRVLTGIKVEDSPTWLKEALHSIGLTSINNVVDATNYIMYDLGQPLHAFDLQKISDHKIIVRQAKNKEVIRVLSGDEIVLSKEDIVIADAKQPLALAGIMGGFESAITGDTKDIVIEAAEFDPKVIRKSSKRLNISTDASYRFERGIDSGGIEYTLNAVAKLIKEIAGGEILSGIVSDGVEAPEIKIDIDYAKIKKLLGLEISNEKINQYLNLLGFKISKEVCAVPTWRKDVSIIEDLAEEVGRIHGYENILSLGLPKMSQPIHSKYYFKEIVKDELYKLGFSEQYNYPFVSSDQVVELGLDATELLEVINPVQPENRYLRMSLVPRLLHNVSKNQFINPIKIFEIGSVYNKNSEEFRLTLAMNSSVEGEIDAVLEKLLNKLKINKNIFTVSKLFKDDLNRYKIKKNLIEVAEVNIDQMLKLTTLDWKSKKLSKMAEKSVYRPVSKFPSITRDLSFILNSNVSAEEIINDVYNCSELVNRVELFDEFESDKFGKNNKSLAFHLFLQASDRTLNENEAASVIDSVIKFIVKKYEAILRDK